MIKQQETFTETEAVAICEMIAALAADDYKLAIYFDKAETGPDGELYYPFIAQVIDTDLTVVTAGRSYRLMDALSDAYQSTPERKATNE